MGLSVFDRRTRARAAALGAALQARGWWVTTAESCTGGGIAQAITTIAGSSAWFDRAYVTYSDNAKIELLRVDAMTLARHGAVSRETALAMASGALQAARAEVAVAVTGIAGPGGGSLEKPIGTVWVGYAVRRCAASAQCHLFKGDRDAVRMQTVDAALAGLLRLLDE